LKDKPSSFSELLVILQALFKQNNIELLLSEKATMQEFNNMHAFTSGEAFKSFVKVTFLQKNEMDFEKVATDPCASDDLFKRAIQIIRESNIFNIKNPKDIKLLAVEVNSPLSVIMDIKAPVSTNTNKFFSFEKEATITLIPVMRYLTLSEDQFDKRGTVEYQLKNHGRKTQRGGLPYYLPIGWKRFGINVLGKYANMDDSWLLNWDESGWAVGYYGVGPDPNLKISSIVTTGLNPDDRQAYANHENIRKPGQLVGNGSYFGTHVEVGEHYSNYVDIDGIQCCIVVQCRLNPAEIRIPQKPSVLNRSGRDWANDYMVVPDSTNIRPYGILIQSKVNTEPSRCTTF